MVHKECTATTAARMSPAIALLDIMYHCHLDLMQIHQVLHPHASLPCLLIHTDHHLEDV